MLKECWRKKKKDEHKGAGEGGRLKLGLTPVKLLILRECLISARACVRACMAVCVCVRLLVFVGHKSMRRAVAFTLGLARSCGGSMQQVRCQSAGRVDVTTLKSRTPHSNITQRNPPAFVVSLLCLFVSATLLYSLLLWLHSIALCCSALWGSHIAGAFVGVSHCDDLMWAVREHQIVSI